jgi:hypothetical protein
MTSGSLVPGLSFCQDFGRQSNTGFRSEAVALPPFQKAPKRERRVNMFSSLLIELELYAIVVGLAIAIFVFLARERLRKMNENGDGIGQPLVEHKDAIPDPFMRAGSSF